MIQINIFDYPRIMIAANLSATQVTFAKDFEEQFKSRTGGNRLRLLKKHVQEVFEYLDARVSDKQVLDLVKRLTRRQALQLKINICDKVISDIIDKVLTEVPLPKRGKGRPKKYTPQQKRAIEETR
jgi:hypothetical protein